MATPVFTFNAVSGGSDTQASGAGPATAVFGTNASFAASVATLDGSPDLSGVLTDGSHVLWLLTSTGRQYFTINAVDDTLDTVTLDDAPTGTSTGRTWAIGGKRATFNETNSRNLFATSLKDGWVMITETDQSLTTALVIAAQGSNTAGPMVLKGDSESTLRVITQTGIAIGITTSNGAILRIENLKLQNSNATKTGVHAINFNSGQYLVRNCVFGDATNQVVNGINSSNNPSTLLVDCRFVSCISNGISHSGIGPLRVINCVIAGNAAAGITSAGTGQHTVEDCLITGNTGVGFVRTGVGAGITWTELINSVIHGNGGDGIDLATAGSTSYGALIYGNNITANGGYGINGHTQTDVFKYLIDYNNFGTSGGTANTSGALNNISAGPHDLAVDPLYVNAAGGNFACGTPIKAEGYPDSTRTIGANAGSTTAFVDIGVQRQEAGGGGGPIFGGMVVR